MLADIDVTLLLPICASQPFHLGILAIVKLVPKVKARRQIVLFCQGRFQKLPLDTQFRGVGAEMRLGCCVHASKKEVHPLFFEQIFQMSDTTLRSQFQPKIISRVCREEVSLFIRQAAQHEV